MMKIKKLNRHKNCIIKEIKFKDYKICLEAAQFEKKAIQKKMKLMQIALKKIKKNS